MFLEDKRVVLTKNLEIRVVIGNEHPPGCYIAYLKYVYTGKGLWKGFERVVKDYNPYEVRKGSLVYDPNFGTEVPCLSYDEVLLAPDPLERVREVLAHPKDRLEVTTLEVLIYTKDLGIRELGVGGSLLLGIHHEDSDVDLLIYPSNDPLEIWERLESSDLEEDKEWPIRVSRSLNLPVEAAKSLYSKAKRAKFGTSYVSFSFVKREPLRYGYSAAVPIGPFSGTLELEPCVEGIFYPHRCWSNKYLIESYESAFVKVFVKGGKVKVKGYLWERSDGTKVIRVGGREERGYLLFA